MLSSVSNCALRSVSHNPHQRTPISCLGSAPVCCNQNAAHASNPQASGRFCPSSSPRHPNSNRKSFTRHSYTMLPSDRGSQAHGSTPPGPDEPSSGSFSAHSPALLQRRQEASIRRLLDRGYREQVEAFQRLDISPESLMQLKRDLTSHEVQQLEQVLEDIPYLMYLPSISNSRTNAQSGVSYEQHVTQESKDVKTLKDIPSQESPPADTPLDFSSYLENLLSGGLSMNNEQLSSLLSMMDENQLLKMESLYREIIEFRSCPVSKVSSKYVDISTKLQELQEEVVIRKHARPTSPAASSVVVPIPQTKSRGGSLDVGNAEVGSASSRDHFIQDKPQQDEEDLWQEWGWRGQQDEGRDQPTSDKVPKRAFLKGLQRKKVKPSRGGLFAKEG